MNSDLKRGHLDLMILSVLRGGPLHGYAVISALRERSNGVFDLAEGSVYPTLHRLEDSGLIGSEWEFAAGRKRRLYEITRAGRAALVDRTAEWRRWSGGLNGVLEWSRS
jgi:PadR family transcriptional regulator PadR